VRAWLEALRIAAGPAEAKTKVAPFAPAKHPECVQPGTSIAMAMDESMPVAQPGGEFVDGTLGSYLWGGEHFLGFGMLALLAQKPELRRMYEVLATEMTRKGIKFQSTGDDDKGDKIREIEDAFRQFRVMDLMRRVAEGDGSMGRGHIYIDLGSDDPRELATPIGSGCDAASKAKVAKGGLKGLRTVEAMWCYPSGYNSQNPLHPHWYRPQQWIVPGQTVHATRLLTFVGREVPDILKPAYSFGGLSLSQIALPYVENWIKTRESVSDLINAFSVMVLSTPMGALLQSGGDQLAARITNFVTMRSNKGLMVVDKDKEDLKNVSANIGGLEGLQAQSQEQMAAVCGIPLVKLLGITPNGMNASTEGEIRVFYDWVHAYQEMLFRPNLQAILGFVQLHVFGEVDPEITFAFEPLWSMSDKELAEVRKLEAETAQVYIDSGTLSPPEDRKRLADDPESLYHGLDPDDLPDLQAEAEAGLEAGGEGGGESLLGRFQATEEGEDDATTDRVTGLFDRVQKARGRDAA
jgi:hypothetical protein